MATEIPELISNPLYNFPNNSSINYKLTELDQRFLWEAVQLQQRTINQLIQYIEENLP